MEIKIARTARQCRATGRPFEHGQGIVSLVRYEEQLLLREDYARDSWDPAVADGAIAVWDAMFIDPAVAQAEPEESFSPLRRLFYEHAEGSERLDCAVCYLAAQLLRRQKVFRLVKETESQEDGAKLTLFADRIGDRLIEVRDPSLTYSELEAGRAVLVQCLESADAPSDNAPNDDNATKESADGSREEAAHAGS